MKLHSDCIKFINNIIDMRTPLNDTDREFIAASIIQATPRSHLPGVDDIDTEGCLMDMIAGYMKSADPDRGQEILDYIASNTVKHFEPVIDEIISDKIQDSKMDREDQARWERNR